MGLASIFKTRDARDSRPPPPAIKKTPFIPADKVKLADDALARALQVGRLGAIIASPPDWAKHPHFKQTLKEACKAVDERFALVPEGYASLAMTVNDEPGCPEEDHTVAPFLLCQHAVTNADYQLFVDCGAYDDYDLWPELVWPHLIGFKDQTGNSGPRYWRDGRHDKKHARHPVVGVSWFEAQSYARWAGFRMPTEAEWQVAASWRLKGEAPTARRYPWGDTLDLECCNIWSTGHGSTLPVEACTAGAAPNGVQQLIGNVWEWVDADFNCADDKGRKVVGETVMKGIRGGAFDTYFPWQAASAFRSGASCLARVHNVGFRCAMDLMTNG